MTMETRPLMRQSSANARALAPEDAAGVDALDRLLDAAVRTKVIDRVAATIQPDIIIDDDKAARRYLVIEKFEALPGRAVEIEVEAQNGERPDRRLRQALGNPAGDELHLAVEQAVAREMLAHPSLAAG